MPIDPSVYAKLGQNQGANLFGPFAEFAYGSEALSQNRLLMQTYAAKQGIGQAVKMHTDANGNVDWGAAVGTAAAQGNPMAAEFRNQVLAGNLTDQQTLGASLDNYKKQTAAIAGAAYAAAQGMAGSNPNAPADTKALMSNVADLLHVTGANGEQLFPSATLIPHIANIVGQYKTNGQLKAGLMQIAQNGMTASERIQNLQTSPDLYRGPTGKPLPGQVNVLAGTAAPLQDTGPGASTADVNGAPNAPATPAPGAPTLGGLSPFETERLDAASKYGQDVAGRAQQANGLVAQMNIVQRYLRDVNTGAFAEDRAELANALRTFGVAPEIYNKVASGSLDDAQAAMKTFMGTGIQQAGQLIHGIGGGKLAQQETMQFLAKGAPNINMASGAVAKVLASMRELSHWATLENEYYQRKVGLAKAGGYDISNVQNDWGNTMAQMLQAQGGQQ